MAAFEDDAQKLEHKLAGLKSKGKENTPPFKKIRLELAHGKQALLASKLLLWTTARTQDIRMLVVNWDICAVRAPRPWLCNIFSFLLVWVYLFCRFSSCTQTAPTEEVTGELAVYVEPAEEKSAWRQTTAKQVMDVGKRLHPSL